MNKICASCSAFLSLLTRSSVLYLALLLIPLCWLTYAVAVSREHDKALNAAELRLANVTLVYEQHLETMFLNVDRSLLLLRLLYEKDPDSFDLKYWTDSADLTSGTVIRFSILDRDGYIRATSGGTGQSTYLGDRDYFVALRDSDQDVMRVTAVGNGRVISAASIKIARRLRGRDGRFAGALVGSLDPNDIVKFFSTANLGTHGSLSLRNADLTILAAEGLSSTLVGTKLSAPPLEAGLKRGPIGFYWGGGIIDGINRLVAYRKSQRAPLVMVAGMGEDEILAAFLRQRAIYRIVAALFTLLMMGAVAWDVWRAARLHEAQRAREELIERFQSAAEHMPHGLSMFDKEQRLVAYNSKYLQLYDLSPAEYHVGCTLEDFLKKRKENGQLSEDVEEYLTSMRARHASGVPLQSIDTVAKGRIIHITTRIKNDGGWVSTHEDVTEKRHAEKELIRVKNFLDTIIQNIPMPIVIKDARSRKILLANRAYVTLHELQPHGIEGSQISDLFAKETADRIRCDDIDALNSEGGRTSVEFAINTEDHGRRSVMVQRLVVRDDDGIPEFLISLIDDVTDRRDDEAKIMRLARYDPLTGLVNRSLFREQLEELIARQRREGAQFAIFMIDLDRFKQVNDAYGHHVGDGLLKEVAKRVRDAIRDSDVAARLGGDEFALIVLGARDDLQDVCKMLAERLVRVIGEPFDIEGKKVNIGCSVGIALYPAHGERSELLLRSADLALYKAKSGGRNSFCFYSEELKAEADRRNALENDLRQAIWREEFELFYQPIVSTGTGRIVAVEALLRWRHPILGLVPPDQFIPLAEESGLIVQLGDWALNAACRDARLMRDDIKVAVNVSAVQFAKSNIVDSTMLALADADLPPERLEIEITETVLLRDSEQNLEALRQLQRLGVSIALDDFGVGYSSLSYLTSFPFDKVKIDRSFIARVERPEAGAVIDSIVHLAKTLKLVTCAEGIETGAQFANIRELGIELCQGYFLGSPVPLAKLDLNCTFDVREQIVA
jgi:diguanylate cyclase (GGDEF)-like protein/PAS domain S-box-containing protein